MLNTHKNMPIPPRRYREKIYKLDDFAINESQFFPGRKTSDFGSVLKQYPNKKFTCRKVIELDRLGKYREGTRIWRVL